jgi:hypothetical protein
VYTNPHRYHAAIARRLAAAVALFVTLVGAGAWLMAHRNTGWAVATAAVALVFVPAICNGWEVWIGERRRPRDTDLDRPLTGERRQLVNEVVATAGRLDNEQRDALTAAWAAATRHPTFRHVVDRAMLTADWSGRLYGEDHDNFGAEAFDAVAHIPGAFDAVLGVLVADLAHPADVDELLTAWIHAGLPVPTPAAVTS